MANGNTTLSSVVGAIGGTPLVELSRIAGGSGRLLAKLEYLNPGGSKKDRVARRILENAIAAGLLAENQPVVELTSGNTGTGAAMVCAVQRRPFVAVMSRGNSSERAIMMRAFGAEVVLVDQASGETADRVSGADLALAERKALEIVRERRAFYLNQFVRVENAHAHEWGTAAEIWEASGGTITAFCDFVGSGGTYAGLHRAFKHRNPQIRGYIVEPVGAAVLGGGSADVSRHRIQGGGYSRRELPLLAGIEPDGFVIVTDDEAVEAARGLAREEGIFAGVSAGANVAAALKLLARQERGGTVVVLINDSGLKYLSTDLWRSS
ncbi:MAG: cysteine synthase family protein [Rhizomicrobium sp.]|jgi:cysteine synthase A